MRLIPTPILIDECPSVIHAQPCEHCPSAHYEPDPETLDILALPLKEKIATVFPFGWRQEALCKGYCDLMGVTAEMLDGLPKVSGSTNQTEREVSH